MDGNSESNLGESPPSSTLGYLCDNLAVNNSTLYALSATCALCHRILSLDNESGDMEAISFCGDCKFLLLEDLETTSPDVYPRRMPVPRRRYNSSESIDSIFSQQFLQMITLARQNQSTVFEHDNQSVDGDGAARLVQRTSSRTTPSGSRRWRRGFSDTESDGFDSLYGESESNVSFRRYRAFHGEADTISYSAYGGDSDASVDGQSFLENENFGHPNGESDLESDTDIDPMNAGLYQWNSEDEEEEDEGEDDSEWEEAGTEGNTLEAMRAQVQLHGSTRSDGSNVLINWRRQLLAPEVEGTFPVRILEGIRVRTGDLLTNFGESEGRNYNGGSGDYIDARGFENLLEHLAETESSRRGAPPASVSFVNNMPCMTITEDKVDGTACAICKDSFTVGTVINQLPCYHLYHPSCIIPWLSARNTCPLCRYELPTDDKDYEARKRNGGTEEYETLGIQQHDVNDDSSLDAMYDGAVVEPSQLRHGGERELVNADSVGENGARDIPRNRWFFLAAAAAPIVGMVGISLMLWFGNPSADRRSQSGRIPLRKENSQRRWWSFF
ncbi:Anaphase-promoting complex (APC), subunit 11 [Handroanthus impetiginosus]|uniref:RING-type E3 ubiquitin transferase n=1 Tax=Handroanthus impetiginosus TaxID=429701 RepID=A0A2G9GK39_9LAMI|nr:Anaphase-promoting complex (APC), subunit 11 [Handroanthus impetiginosus]